MSTVTGLTAARMLAIEAASVVDGDVVGDNLILTKHDASTIDAGNVRGPQGVAGATFHGALDNADVILWGADTNLYRSAPNTLKTDDSLLVTGGLRGLGVTSAYYGAAADVSMGNLGPAAEAGMTFGSAADTNLYRSAANTLKTDDALLVTGGLRGLGVTSAYYGAAAEVSMGNLGPSAQAGMTFGSAADTNLYRTAADFLKTDDAFGAGTELYARLAAAAQVALGAGGPSAEAGIVFGSALDTNLYRSAANTLKTDDALLVTGGLRGLGVTSAYYGAAADVSMGNLGPSAQAGMTFGSAADTNLYRSAADTLKTDDALIVAGNTTVQSALSVTGVIAATGALRADQGNGGATTSIYFGSALDTNLYRSAADTLKTDDVFHVNKGLIRVFRDGTPAQYMSLTVSGGEAQVQAPTLPIRISPNAADATSTMFATDGSVRLSTVNGGGFIGLPEQSADPAATADVGRVYCKDNGAGKTQLLVRFATGAVQVIATEP